MINIEHCEETLSEQTWQLAVLQEADLINAFRLVVTPAAQVLIDVLKVRQAHLHFKLVCLCGFRERQRLRIVVLTLTRRGTI